MIILDIALKDLTRSLRSTFAIGMSVVVPLLLIGLIYLAFGGGSNQSADLPAIKVGVVNTDRQPADSPFDEPLGTSIRSLFFDESVSSWITASDYVDETAARDALARQEIGVAVLVPPDFSEQVLAGRRDAQVLILADPTLTITPQIAQNMVAAMLDGVNGGGIAIQTVIERQQALGIQPDAAQMPALVERYAAWYTGFMSDLFHQPDRAAIVLASPALEGASENPILKMLGAMMAGQMAFFAFFTGAYAMMSILRENEEGTLARLFSTPVNRTAILAGKFLAVFISVLFQGIVLMTASHFVFKVEWGNLWAAGLVLLSQVIAATGLGVLLISLAKTTRQGGTVLGGGLTALGMISGLFTANIEMPAAFNFLANFTPQGWVLKGWKIVLSGQPVAEIVLPTLVACILGAAMFAAGAKLFRKRFS